MRPIAVTLTSKSWPSMIRAVGLAAVLLLSSGTHAAEDNPVRHRAKAESPPVAERIIVKFRGSSGVSIQAAGGGESPGTAAANLAADTARMNALANRGRFTVRGSRALGGNMHVMNVAPLTNNETVAETLARLRADSDVELAEIDRRVYPHAMSNDPLGPPSGQWFLQTAQPSAINAMGAWDITKGSNGVIVAVVDTGVRFEHPDLGRASFGGKFLPGYDFISGDSGGGFNTANDGNGRDSDPADPGDDCDGDSSSWHGTRVSGIIAAQTNNSQGVAGILWNGYIVPVRVIGRCGGFNSDVIAGIRWAAGLSVPGAPANPYPAQVINVSLGGEGACDSASAQAINDVANAGALVVVSAGNEGGPVDSPANCPGAMGILGLRHAGTKVGFSSLGPQIALGAPGGNCVNINGGPCVYSLDTTANSGTSAPGGSSYTSPTSPNLGTSFSSPIVSGIAGLMLSVNGNLKSRQLIKRMQDGATKPYPTSSETQGLPTCHTPTSANDIQQTECVCTTSVCGAGMANALGAVNEALRPIAAVSAPASVSGGSNFNVQGSGSAAACGRSISSYLWSQVSGTAVAITNGNTPTATVTAPATGTATIRLTVTDDMGKVDTADLIVSSTSTSTTAPSSAGTKACLTDAIPPNGVAIAATDASASEAGPDPGTVTVSRVGNMASALNVTLSISGTALNGSDYQSINGSVTIPAGAASATVTVMPINNTTVSGSRSVTLTAVAGLGYEVSDSSAATVSIADDDTQPSGNAPSNNGGGGGGGGALDLLTLLGALGFVVLAARRQRPANLSATSSHSFCARR